MEKVSNKKVIAVVVTYNRKELLKECINSLLKQDYNNCDILVVDNASTDGTKDFIKKELENKKVHYVNTGSNLGGAGGFNFGIKKAYELKGEFIWLMDDDCMVHKDTLSNLLKAGDELNNEYGFLASKVLWKDGSICKMNIQKCSLTKKNDDWDSKLIKVIMSSFVSFFVRTKVVEELGLPISDFFIWADDVEYSRRISRKYPCYLVNDSVVTHKSKNNIGSNIAVDDESNFWRYKYSYRNEMYIFKREGFVGRVYYFLKRNYHKIKVRKNAVSLKKDRIDIINNSSKEGKRFNPKIEYINRDDSDE